MFNNEIEYKVIGKYALFSEPITRTGGEKNSYSVPTYEALKGITESIYWKPTIIWVIDSVRIMNRIQAVSKSTKPMLWDKDKPQLSIYSYLLNVEYQVKAHFVWNEKRKDLEKDRNPAKHLSIVQRAIDKGGRRDIFLGCRECQAYVVPENFGTNKGYYDDMGDFNLGVMFHGWDYPTEVVGINTIRERYAVVKIHNGIINFDNPNTFDEEKNNPNKFIITTTQTMDYKNKR